MAASQVDVESYMASLSNEQRAFLVCKRDQIMYHIKVLEHAATCVVPTCFVGCQQLKERMCHVKKCSVPMCKSCLNFRRLVARHTTVCKHAEATCCPVPECAYIRIMKELENEGWHREFLETYFV
jgi:hypothetical protein